MPSKKVKPEAKPLVLTDLLALKPQDYLKREPVEIAEWGGTVYIQELTGAQHEKLWQSRKGKQDDDFNLDESIQILLLAVVDEEGNQLFTDREKSVAWLRKQPGSLLIKLAQKAGAMNEIKDTEKN